jgi:two-component system, cell cycle response regulator DivK
MAKLVIIEDNPLNMKLVSVILTHAGHTLRSAATAEEGLALIKADIPDAVVMDIHLPGMNGLDATRLIKTDPALKAVKVIALTASAMSGDAQRILDAGCDAYVSKPVRYESFLAVLDRVLAG